MSKSDNGNWEYTEKKIKDFVCVDERHHMYISVSDIVAYHLNTGEGTDRYYWSFYLCDGGKSFGSENFETEEKAFAWFDKKFKPFEDK